MLRKTPVSRYCYLNKESQPKERRNPMFKPSKTEVSQTYTSSQNVSVTVRDGHISKVTLWTTGATASETIRFGK